MEPASTTGMPRNRKAIGKVTKSNQEFVSPAESDDDSATCDTILVARSKIGGEEEMKRDAKGALERALQKEVLHVKDVRGLAIVAGLASLVFQSSFTYSKARSDRSRRVALRRTSRSPHSKTA